MALTRFWLCSMEFQRRCVPIAFVLGSYFIRVLFISHALCIFIRYAPCICVINIGIWEDGRWCQRSGLGTLHVPGLSYDIPRISHSIPYTYPAHLVHFMFCNSLCTCTQKNYASKCAAIQFTKKTNALMEPVIDFVLLNLNNVCIVRIYSQCVHINYVCTKTKKERKRHASIWVEHSGLAGR